MKRSTRAPSSIANISYRLGRSVDFDPATLTFPRDAEADRLLTREYRAPYVLPHLAGSEKTP